METTKTCACASSETMRLRAALENAVGWARTIKRTVDANRAEHVGRAERRNEGVPAEDVDRVLEMIESEIRHWIIEPAVAALAPVAHVAAPPDRARIEGPRRNPMEVDPYIHTFTRPIYPQRAGVPS